MVIAVLDHVAHCDTARDGDVIYGVVARMLTASHRVTLSFDGIFDVPSSFINASIVRLVEDFGMDAIKRDVSIIDVTTQISDMIRRCVRNANRELVAA